VPVLLVSLHPVAQTRKRRRRKHRGTQTGRIDRSGPRGRPRTREEARARARAKRKPAKGKVVDRRDIPPTWGSAFKRGLFGAAIFFLLFWLLFQRPIGGAVVLSVVMLVMYVPMGYYIDSFMYRRRQRQLQAERLARKQQG
jgi:hypothetical protein